jgi:Ca2+:H+ antiporter
VTLDWLLLFVPVAIALEHFAPEAHRWIFLSSALAIIPLAGRMGHATERIAERTGEAIGGLLNATFGNAAELIITLAALRKGLHEVVKASLVGGIVGNILLVLGASMLAGGLRFPEQRFSGSAARSQATMLSLTSIALIAPSAYHAAAGGGASRLGELSVAISVVLLVSYGLLLVFSFGSRGQPSGGSHQSPPDPGNVHPPVLRPVLVLAAATALVAWMSEILVGAIEPVTKELGLNYLFVGVFLVALLATAAELFTAVTAARKDRMDLSLSIGLGAGVQVSLFIAPVLVLVSLVIGPAPLDLAFKPGLVLLVFLSVLVTVQVTGDGESNWIKGAQLLAVYLILALVFYFAPGPVEKP